MNPLRPNAPTTGGGRGFAATIVQQRGWILLAWVAACVLLLPAARRIESVLQVSVRVAGSDSAAVEEQLGERFTAPLARPLIVVVSGLPSPTIPAGEEGLRTLVAAVRSAPGVAHVMSYLDRREELLLGAGPAGGTILVVGLVPAARPDTLLPPLRHALRAAEASLRGRFPELALRSTGEVALNADLRQTSAADAKRAELRALPIILILLLLAFRTPIAAVLPIVAGLLAIGVALGLAAFANRLSPLSISVQNVVTMIGLGLGIDYSLLMVGRFRHELQAGLAPPEAAREATRRAGPTIALSGVAVAIGFGTLATSPVSELYSVAMAGLLVVGCSVLISTTLLPGLLAMIGPWINAGGRRPVRSNLEPRWQRWAQFVTRHPLQVLLLAGLPVGLLAWQARDLHLELPRGDWLPREMESAQGLRALQAMGRSALPQALRIILELPAGTPALSAAGWSATERLAATLAADGGVQRVHSLPALVAPWGGYLPREVLLAQIPGELRRGWVRNDAGGALLEVWPREQSSPVEMKELVRRIRGLDAPAATGLPGARLLVGGIPALNVDYQDAVAGRFFHVVVLIVGATFLALAVGFRSLLIPLKAIALNLLAVAATFGAVTLVFQKGHGATLLGLDGPLDAVFPAIPVLVFCIVFGLSMDYEVFLVARIREARAASGDEHAAIVAGLMHTGSLITSAAAIMVVVFGAFTLGDFVLIKMLGFALAVAVLLDATVMRLAIGPALLTLAGRWNWWPGRSR